MAGLHDPDHHMMCEFSSCAAALDIDDVPHAWNIDLRATGPDDLDAVLAAHPAPDQVHSAGLHACQLTRVVSA